MKATRRQRQQYLFGALLAAVGIVNLLFFLILYRPARAEYFRLQTGIESLRAETQVKRNSLTRLEKLSAQLDTSEMDKQRLVRGYFIPYDIGFSELLPKLDAMAQRSGVRKADVDYDISDAPQYRLYSVKIRIPVQGAYPNVINFIRELETSDTFFAIESIDIRSAAGANVPAGSEISLSLGLETFFYQ